MNTKPVFHGSDIEKICEYYHLNQEDIVNFGANVNPIGISTHVKQVLASHLDLLSSYPDRDYQSLRNTVSEYCGVPADYVLPGNGSSELISLLIETRAPKRTLLLGPTYSEYSRELSLSNSKCNEFLLKETDEFILNVDFLCQSLLAGSYDFLIICNPNNPTSSAILRSDMERLLTFCEQHDIFVMIDETYVEFAPVIEDVTAVPFTKTFKNLMVLRGVSKFFAAPGVRLGYGITGNMPFLKAMKEKQIPWSLNSLGAFAGELMLKDEEYIRQTRRLILSEREKMYSALKEQPAYKTYKPYANFLLVKLLQKETTAFDVFTHCVKNGLMIRDCSSFKSLDGEFIRFCVMDSKDNQRLLDELSFLCLQK